MRISPDVGWVVEARGVAVTSRRGRLRVFIHYPHAAIWALLTVGTFTPSWAREVVEILMSLSPSDAEREVARTLAAWREAGLVEGE